MVTQTLVNEDIKKIPVWLVSITILFPTAFAMLATSETNVAIPHIAGYFGATLDEANWVITSYMVANAILLPLTAWFENYMGRVIFFKNFYCDFYYRICYVCFCTESEYDGIR